MTDNGLALKNNLPFKSNGMGFNPFKKGNGINAIPIDTYILSLLKIGLQPLKNKLPFKSIGIGS
jgi:hypothetical protein